VWRARNGIKNITGLGGRRSPRPRKTWSGNTTRCD
jgi:hypothetical protein